MAVIIDDKTIQEISDIIYKAFKDSDNLKELDALCKFVEQNIPPISPRYPPKPQNL